MPARTATNPPNFLTAPPITNAPIDYGRKTKATGTHHHCPHRLNGPHNLSHRCLTNNHVGYCETCKYLASQYVGCNKCGSRRLSRVPPSHISRVTGEGNEGRAQNELVTSKDILCKDVEDEDEGWGRAQEKKAKEQDKVRGEAAKRKETKPRSESTEINEAKIEEFEKARKEQQKQTNKNRLMRGIKGLLRRK